jgi:pimeloyl-ACP methyl ester carboxylesterase
VSSEHIQDGRNAMPAIDWNDALGYAQLVHIAEKVAAGDEYSNAEIEAIQAQGYRFLEALYGDELATDLHPHAGAIVTYGFLGLSPSGELVAAMRGTKTIFEWIHDAMFLMVPNPVSKGAGMTEDGFTAMYKSLRVERDRSAARAVQSMGAFLQAGKAQRVTVAGHSMGAALATLLALDVALNTPCRSLAVYTFGSSKVGDRHFASSFNASIAVSYRIFSRGDVIANLPPILPLPYEHTNTPIELVPPAETRPKDIAWAHQFTTYMWLMEQQLSRIL